MAKLYLIPTTLGDSKITDVIPELVTNTINNIDHYIVENVRTARRYLKKAGIISPIDDLHFFELNKHTSPSEINEYLKPIKENKNIGLISEAGVPGVADPGAEIVKLAHQNKIDVVPLTGPSSILLSLMASGFNGQSFAFVGYLPIKSNERSKKLSFLEKRSQSEDQTQMFIETPYRNQKLFDDLLTFCSNNTMLCIACDITLENEFIKTKSIADWKKNKPSINKRPTIFLIHKFH